MHCEKEKELQRLNDEIWGNGRKGLVERVNSMENEMKTYKDDVKNINSNIEVLTRYKTQEEAKSDLKKESKTDRKWFIGMLLTTLVSLITMILNVVL